MHTLNMQPLSSDRKSDAENGYFRIVYEPRTCWKGRFQSEYLIYCTIAVWSTVFDWNYYSRNFFITVSLAHFIALPLNRKFYLHNSYKFQITNENKQFPVVNRV